MSSKSTSGTAPVRPDAPAEAAPADLVALIASVAAGDEKALASVYDATAPRVFGFALRIVRDRPAAEEVTLDVFTQVFHQAARYDPARGTPLAWLLTMTRSRALTRLRADGRRHAREAPLEDAGRVRSETGDPGDWTAASESRDRVAVALAALGPEQRRVIEMAYYDGLTQSEIAEALDLPLGTVKTRIRLGMTKLRDQFDGRTEEPGR